jgi:hypothetical protein
MRNLKNILLYLFFLFIFLNAIPLNESDTVYGFKGKVYFNDLLVTNEKLKIISYFRYDPKTKRDVHYIKTDQNGNYELKIDLSVLTGNKISASDDTAKTDRRKDKILSLPDPGAIGFIYHKKEIKIPNQFWDYYEKNKYHIVLEHDLRF